MKGLIFMILLWGTAVLQGQNLLDDQGRKTGPWKVEYPGGSILYEATFHQGNPVGEMIRYYENGAVRARIKFDPEPERNYTVLFYQNGKKAAEGRYLNQLKDSVWTYYSEFDGAIILREPYVKGKLHGMVRHYYPTGLVSEEVNWRAGLKEGSWRQFYENGALRLRSWYEEDSLNGTYEVFAPDSTLWVSGMYLNNSSHGTWHYYDVHGSEVYTIEYREGRPLDREKYLQILQDTLRKYNLILDPDSLQHE